MIDLEKYITPQPYVADVEREPNRGESPLGAALKSKCPTCGKNDVAYVRTVSRPDITALETFINCYDEADNSGGTACFGRDIMRKALYESDKEYMDRPLASLPLLRVLGLLENPTRSDGTLNKEKYRPTQKGRDFLQGIDTIPLHVLVWRGTILARETEVDIEYDFDFKSKHSGNFAAQAIDALASARESF